METNYSKSICYTLVALLLVASAAFACLCAGLAQLTRTVQAQFEYETGRDLCYEEAMSYHAYCHVEKQGDKYHWYFIENELEGDN